MKWSRLRMHQYSRTRYQTDWYPVGTGCKALLVSDKLIGGLSAQFGQISVSTEDTSPDWVVSSPTEYSTREVPIPPMSLSDTNSASHPVPTGYPNGLVPSSPVLTGTGTSLVPVLGSKFCFLSESGSRPKLSSWSQYLFCMTSQILHLGIYYIFVIRDLKNSNFLYNPDTNFHRSWFRFQKSEFFDNLSTFLTIIHFLTDIESRPGPKKVTFQIPSSAPGFEFNLRVRIWSRVRLQILVQ